MGDFHLGASYLDTHSAEKKITSFLDSISTEASHIYLMGDILDYWFEYRNVVPRGYVRFFGKLAELSDAGIKITWLIGNHDIWIFDYLPHELGIEVVDGVLKTEHFGKRFFLTHGDGIGKRSMMFRFIRNVFRNPVCQKMYSAIHPRWTIPFAHNWSRHSREDMSHWQPEFLGSDEPLVQFAKENSITEKDIDFYIFGHRHVEGNTTLPAEQQSFN